MLCRAGAQRTSWNYLTVQLNRTSEDEMGDPDLFASYWGGQSGQVMPCMLTCMKLHDHQLQGLLCSQSKDN